MSTQESSQYPRTVMSDGRPKLVYILLGYMIVLTATVGVYFVYLYIYDLLQTTNGSSSYGGGYGALGSIWLAFVAAIISFILTSRYLLRQTIQATSIAIVAFSILVTCGYILLSAIASQSSGEDPQQLLVLIFIVELLILCAVAYVASMLIAHRLAPQHSSNELYFNKQRFWKSLILQISSVVIIVLLLSLFGFSLF